MVPCPPSATRRPRKSASVRTRPLSSSSSRTTQPVERLATVLTVWLATIFIRMPRPIAANVPTAMPPLAMSRSPVRPAAAPSGAPGGEVHDLKVDPLFGEVARRLDRRHDVQLRAAAKSAHLERDRARARWPDWWRPVGWAAPPARPLARRAARRGLGRGLASRGGRGGRRRGAGGRQQQRQRKIARHHHVDNVARRVAPGIERIDVLRLTTRAILGVDLIRLREPKGTPNTWCASQTHTRYF